MKIRICSTSTRRQSSTNVAGRKPDAHGWIERLAPHAAPGSSYRAQLDEYASHLKDPEFDRIVAEVRADVAKVKRMKHGRPRWHWLAAGAALALAVGLGWLATVWL